MFYEIKKIDLWSAIKISFVINAVIGLAIGLLIGFAIAFLIGVVGRFAPAESSELSNLPFGVFGGFFLGMVYAIILAIFNGVILTSVAVILYNLFSGWLGGIKVDCQAVEPKIGQPTMTIATSTNQPPDGQV
jgi:predicted membrane-bound spermidine synthase